MEDHNQAILAFRSYLSLVKAFDPEVCTAVHAPAPAPVSDPGVLMCVP